jgi:hypothetical protein
MGHNSKTKRPRTHVYTDIFVAFVHETRGAVCFKIVHTQQTHRFFSDVLNDKPKSFHTQLDECLGSIHQQCVLLMKSIVAYTEVCLFAVIFVPPFHFYGFTSLHFI